MTDYDGLKGLIGEIPEAAIEWQMVAMGYEPDGAGGWTIGGGLGSRTQVVDSEGNVFDGGEPVPDPFFRDTFARFRTEIPEVLGRWTDLPDPSYLDDDVRSLHRQMNSLLNPESAIPNESAPKDAAIPELGNGDLHSALETIDEKLGNMQGATATAMYEEVVTKFGDVLRAQFVAVGVLGQHLEAQQRMMQRTRDKVAEIVTVLHETMKNQGGGASIDLSGLVAIGGAVGVFATGALAKTLGAFAAAVGLKDAFLDDSGSEGPAVQISDINPIVTWDDTIAALDTLGDKLLEHELAVARASSSAEDMVAGSPRFDLARIRGEDIDPQGLADDEVMVIDEGGLAHIGNKSIVTATESLDRTRYAIGGVDPTVALTRPSGIGLSITGATPTWAGFRDAVTRALNGTASELWEIRDGVGQVLRIHTATDLEQASRYRPPDPLDGHPAGLGG